jgi:catechol 2,3-dioxygenase-like lactoylglutathione lyase family enzyme
MRLNGICLITEDVAKLRAFYTMLLGIEAEGDNEFTVFRVGDAELSIFSHKGMEAMASGSMRSAGYGGFTLELEVDDPDAQYARLTALGLPVVKPPTTQPWGQIQSSRCLRIGYWPLPSQSPLYPTRSRSIPLS